MRTMETLSGVGFDCESTPRRSASHARRVVSGIALGVTLSLHSVAPWSVDASAECLRIDHSGEHARRSRTSILDLSANTRGHNQAYFEENIGQESAPIRFTLRGETATCFLTDRELVMSIAGPKPHRMALHSTSSRRSNVSASHDPASVSTLRMQFEGAGSPSSVRGECPLAGYLTYFTGHGTAHAGGTPTRFRRVRLANLYPGVDLVYYLSQGKIEYDLVVRPGADLEAVRVRFEGAQSVTLNPSGAIVIRTESGEVVQTPPVGFQYRSERERQIPCSYKINEDGTIGFDVGVYDVDLPFIIDPVIDFSTYIPPASANAVTIGHDGSVYLAGSTYRADFPVVGAIQSQLNETASQ
jgi:hypothetical protein